MIPYRVASSDVSVKVHCDKPLLNSVLLTSPSALFLNQLGLAMQIYSWMLLLYRFACTPITLLINALTLHKHSVQSRWEATLFAVYRLWSHDCNGTEFLSQACLEAGAGSLALSALEAPQVFEISKAKPLIDAVKHFSRQKDLESLQRWVKIVTHSLLLELELFLQFLGSRYYVHRTSEYAESQTYAIVSSDCNSQRPVHTGNLPAKL